MTPARSRRPPEEPEVVENRLRAGQNPSSPQMARIARSGQSLVPARANDLAGKATASVGLDIIENRVVGHQVEGGSMKNVPGLFAVDSRSNQELESPHPAAV